MDTLPGYPSFQAPVEKRGGGLCLSFRYFLTMVPPGNAPYVEGFSFRGRIEEFPVAMSVIYTYLAGGQLPTSKEVGLPFHLSPT
jgi:hypothetical protein